MPATPASPTDPLVLRRLQMSLERAAAVWMALATGDAPAGDRAVAEAMRAQGAGPETAPRALAMRFWRALLRAPGIHPGPLPALPAPLAHLGRLPPGLRVLVLLKLLSGLSEVELAALLDRSPSACRRALARAEAIAGEADWQAWPAALDEQVRTVAPARLVNIAGWRSLPPDPPPAPASARPWRTRALAGVALLTAIALVATWWPAGDGEPRIHTRPLAETAPRSRFDAATALATHPDRALLALDETDAAIARETAFYAWYQAERLGTASYEPPPPTFQAPESATSTTDMGNADAP